LNGFREKKKKNAFSDDFFAKKLAKRKKILYLCSCYDA